MNTQYGIDDEVMVMDKPFIDPNFKSKPMRPWEEVHDELCRRLGKHYGLNDIREALQ